MIRHKWIIGLINQLDNLAMECDSSAAIEGAQMSSTEREKLKGYIEKAVEYIDKTLPEPKK